ncbi:MAG TPA: antirestriction protein ArdA [Allosphingosinicella sp.]|nr:antirestriction protein ArdA [Allosphingosinicella sp.]
MGLATCERLQPRIYVACLAAYNNGCLHGEWIDADQDPWQIYAEISRMLKASPIAGAEEYAIHDFEGFGRLRLSEYTGIEQVARLAAFIVERGELGAAVLSYYSGDLAEAREACEDRYFGTFESVADYMAEFTEECMTIPERLRFYIDWEAMGRDAELSGDLFTIQTAHDEVHVFNAH